MSEGAELRVVAIARIHEGRLDDFESVAADMMASVREKDPGTHMYDWHFNADRTECIVLEHYSGSDAVLAHIGNLGDLFGRFLELCDLELRVFGRPSEELVQASAALDVSVYAPFQTL